MAVQAPPMSAQAVLVNGKATAIFPSRPFRRVVILVDMQNPTSGPVAIYRGTVSGAFTRVTGNSSGSDTQWTNPFNLPAGQSLFVQWDNAPTPVSNALATITWMQER